MLVDFTELRNRVLAGEEDAEAEATPSTLSIETTGNNITLAALLVGGGVLACLLYTSPSPRDRQKSRMPSSA